MSKNYVPEIIDLLSNDSQPLSSPFLKAQIFSSRIGNKELYDWVTLEIKGYEKANLIPSYRKVKCNNNAVMRQHGVRLPLQALPLIAFESEILEMLIRFPIDQGIKALETIVSDSPNGVFYKEYSGDFCAILSNQVKNKLFTVLSNTVYVSNTEITNVLANIRTKLLELMLNLEKDFPTLADTELSVNLDANAVNQTINYFIMKNINIKNTGDGNNINTGDNSTLTNNAIINKGNKQQLKDYLTANGVNEEDINKLSEIIDDEVPELESKSFGNKVGEWIQMMLGKAVTGIWSIGIESAGTVLVKGIQSYYGIS